MIISATTPAGIDGQRGFTLLEVMMSLAFFSVIIVTISMVFISGTRTYHQSVRLAQMRMLTQRALREIRKDLGDARFLDGSNLLDQVEFQRPTPRENTLGELRYINTGTMEPYWGDGETEVDGSGPTHVDNRIRFQFVRFELLDEAIDGVDYNRDGDQTDEFERGRIVRMLLAPDLTLISQSNITHDWVFKLVLPHAIPPDLTGAEYAAFQVDNQGSPDPLFMLIDDDGNPDPAGGRLQVVLFNMQMIDRNPVLVRSETVITPVNK